MNDSFPILDGGDISYKWLWRNGLFSAAVRRDWTMEIPYHESVSHVSPSLSVVLKSLNVRWMRAKDSFPTMDGGDISYKWLWRNGVFSAAVGRDRTMETPYYESVSHVSPSINVAL